MYITTTSSKANPIAQVSRIICNEFISLILFGLVLKQLLNIELLKLSFMFTRTDLFGSQKQRNL